MTERKSLESERAELIAERAELVAKNEAATSWGAAVGARHERIVEIDRQLRRLAAQDQDPVAWQILGLDWKWIDAPSKAAADGCVKDGTALNVRPAPQKPPPAAGWDNVNVSRDMLLTLISVLDCALGDTDPSIDPDYTDEDVKRDYPVFWVCQQLSALSHQPAPVAAIDPRWRTELDEIVSHLGAAITQSVASDDQIIMDHVKAAHEIAKVVRRQA